MPGPPWNDDDPADATRIGDNVAALLSELQAVSADRELPSIEDVCAWHRRLYLGCEAPSPSYLGRFRGDPTAADLVGYEVGVGNRVGVFSVDVAAAVERFFLGLHAAVTRLDAQLPVGTVASEQQLAAVVAVAASLHGEWVRIHPFANGNGRTARLWVAWLAMRYNLPIFVRLKPRPDDSAYADAAGMSMGIPPDFVGDFRPTIAVFARMLAETLAP